MQTRHITCLFIILLVFCFSGCVQKTLRGKLIDADTLKPIKGAVVVAAWDKDRPSFVAGELSFLYDAKETLTDKDGEWSIRGPAGYQGKPGLYKLFLSITIGTTKKPSMIYYKPGYTGKVPGGFAAYAYIDKEKNLEGIMLSRQGETWDNVRAYYSGKYRGKNIPFISVKNPEKKLRNLEFSFKYPENVRTIYSEDSWRDADYVVIGLKKAKTREERNIAIPGRPTSNPEKLPILNKLIDEECEWLRETKQD